ncbi:OmpA family protein [Roseobacter denitrificans]|uniref:OmpA domain protein n=1 Tax=Roseobacter denitrificans (strain ATCC 33942 / OCh 114) TaxID=375451 RepID=Q160R8_ROSDO|nr:OmpA family protein [Roseobacter denitrificans]ABG33525.1 OmpA domain protein [Roseobacter denitrificans OCh 114]AVL52837.1 OmpA family protein [Roseobacter denitrificans]SFG04782.1 OmpA-OmpF porin, OOP family [Roseobacter denitrificans OCh 114]
MPLSRAHLVVTTFAIAAGASLLAASYSVNVIEDRSETEIRYLLDRNGLTWAEVEADGLQVMMAGVAPTEALRFQALSLAGSIVDAARVVDEMEVAAVAELEAPRFSAEVLRNTAGLSVIGLIPQSTDRAALIDGFSAMSDLPITDLLETADYPAPTGWEDAVAYAITAIKDLPRAKVSVEAGRVSITAIAQSAADKAQMEAHLFRIAPPALRVSLNITAPRPVITPFTLRFVKDENGTRFDACSADTDEARGRILDAAFRAGLTGPGRCTVGMGVPSPSWTDAVVDAIDALNALGDGTVTFSDADITLAAAEGTQPALFDRVIGELEATLPDVFVLNAVLPLPDEKDSGPSEFIATLSPEGQVQLRGRMPGEAIRDVADSFAKAKFGSDNVYTATRNVADLPMDWSIRVLAGIEALGFLNSGAVTVTPDRVTLSGRSGNAEASEAIARLMVEKLGNDAAFDVDVAYVEALDPVAALPTAEECEAKIADIMAGEKINFEPGSATIDAAALTTMDQIADVLRVCGDLKLEVQGHTDSQGREEMNRSLSQARAQSVLNELRARRVLTSNFIAKGYGESNPIADNDTEEGREANRRIEFKLIRPEPSVPEGESALESIAEKSDTVTETE